jgi:hypothetical protein
MAVDAAATTMTQKLGGALGGVTAGFELGQGVMGAFGAESEQLEKALLKVQSAMAISQGLQGFKEAIPSFTALKNTAVGAFQGMTTASKVFMVSGIGLLITALAVLIAKWDDVKGALTPATTEAKKFEKSTRESAEAARYALENFDEYEKTLKRVGYTEEQIASKRKQRFKEAIDQTRKEIKASEQVYQAQKDNLETVAIFDALGLNATGRALFGDEEEAKAQRKRVKQLRDDLAKVKNDEYEFRQQQKQAKEEKKKEEEEERKQRQKDASDRAKERREEAKEAASEKQRIINEANAEAKRNAIDANNQLNATLEQIAEENYQKSLSEQDRELLAINDKYFELETLAQGNADALQEIEIAKLNDINDINLKYQQQAYDRDKEAKAKQKELDDKAAQDRIDAEKTVAEVRKQIQNADFENIEAGLNLISSLFENNKKIQAAVLVAENAVSIAKTIMNTQAANQLARAQGTALAIASGGTSVVAAEALVIRNNIGAGISIASQIAATAKGLSALKVGGSPASGSISDGGGGGGGAMTPNFNVVGNSGMNQLAQIQQQPIQAYVVSGEVTSAQALDRNRIKNATL